ncbi:MAG TPA: transposase [Allosphingosinicella sp.]
MPRLIETDESDSIELGELVERLETDGFDPDDEECFASFGPALRKLANNGRFLADLVIEELKQQCARQIARNPYSAQVIVLHTGSRKYLLRANFWPALGDSVVASSGLDPFFYGFPHDHNFSFLTVGYLGSGYWSDYFEYDYETVEGWTGEPVDLRFIERSRLGPGKVLLYRRNLDVHRQLPPDDMSVSLNIVGLSDRSEFLDQYQFDAERGEIAGILNPSSLEALVLLAGHFGGEDGCQLVDDFAARHPSERIRSAALRSKASRIADVDGRIELFERAAAENKGLVAAVASREARRVAAARSWIESAAG